MIEIIKNKIDNYLIYKNNHRMISMSIEDLIDKNKIQADNYITVIMVISYLLFVLFFRMEAFLAMVVYPFSALVIYGILKIIAAFNKRSNDGRSNLNKVLFGIISIVFAVLMLNLILSQPNITSNIIISLIAFPLTVVGYAAIIKGLIVNKYKVGYRIFNIFIGIATIVTCFLGMFYVITDFLVNILALFLILLLNILSRAALYLSEYGLSIIHVKNLKLFLYIISDYLIFVDRDGNIILNKIQ